MRKITSVYLFFVLVALFGVCFGDTADKLDDPEVLRQLLPRLKDQVHWTDLASPEQIKLYEGPETVWQAVDVGEFDLSGFNPKVLGSKLPAVGVHPRVFFSPEDVPGLQKRFKGSKQQVAAKVIYERTIWDPKTNDGKWYSKLAKGDLEGLEFEDPFGGPNGNHQFKGLRSRVYITHTPHIPRIIASAAAYCVFSGDDRRGKEVANVVYNYYKLRESVIDMQNSRGTMEYIEKYKRGEVELEPWPNDIWRGMHLLSGDENVGLAYDLTANWMSEQQKKLMRRVISKMTKGKRAYGQNSPIRWRDTNWVGWDLTLPITAMAIQGEEGFDEELMGVAEETLSAYLTWGINKYGTILETNGKNGAGLAYALRTAVVLARQGRTNYFGHPHLRKLADSQVHNVVPAGGRNVNNGTYGCSLFGGNAKFLAAAYPDSKTANWMIREGREPVKDEPIAQYRFRLAADAKAVKAKGLKPISWWRTRPDGFLYMWVPEVEFAQPIDKKTGKQIAAWEREHLDLPLDFADEIHGQINTRSSNDKDAVYLMMEARPDLYVGGHQHHDAGHFYLSALGVDWGLEGSNGSRNSDFHSIVMIDGKGQGIAQHCAAAKVKWLGATIAKGGAVGHADLKNGYDYIWTTPMHYSWAHEESKEYKWEPATDPELVKIFKGTQNYKGRAWMHSYFNWNWGPTMRAKYNPVQYAYRSAAVIRGEHAYAIVVDDVKKDDAVRLYQWQMQIRNGLVAVDYNAENIEPTDIVLGVADADGKVKAGEPLLLIRQLSQDKSGDYSIGVHETYRNRKPGAQPLRIDVKAAEADFRMVLVPFRHGDEVPKLAGSGDKVTLQWKGQKDMIRFWEDGDMTKFEVKRGFLRVLKVE